MITQKKMIRNIFILIISTVALMLIFYNGLIERNYTIYTDKLLKNQSMRVVLIADLHSHIYGKNQKEIADLIRKQNPDLIALTGDIADDRVPIDGTELFLQAIKDISPIYYVTGNHEIWSGELDYIKDIFRNYGVTVLENEYERVNINGVKFIIGGVDDPAIELYKENNFDWGKAVYQAFLELEEKPGYKILLSHRPEQVDIYKNLNFDMVLSGHSHGGQVRIPFLVNGFLSANQGWFPKYSGGVYEYDNITHIVSRGLSYNPKRPRIFNPPEVVVVDVIGIK